MLWVTVFSTFSAMHLLAHAVWAQAAMVVGAVQLAVVRGKLASPRWSLLTSGALFLSGVAFIVHEQNPWLFSRSAFLHHAIGWVVVVAALFPLGERRPRAVAWRAGFAVTFVVAVLLFADRDLAPIFGRLSDTAAMRARIHGAADRCGPVAPSGARAHATLVEALPDAQSSVGRAPAEIRLHFNEVVTIGPGAVRVLGRREDHSGAASLSADGLVVTATVSGSCAARGTRSAGARRARTATLRPASTTSASGSSAATHGGRGRERDDVEGRSRPLGTVRRTRGWSGPLVVRAAILRATPPAVERRFHLVPTVAAFAVIDVGIVVFLVRASNALQPPFGDLYGDLQPFAENTRLASFLVMTVGFAVVAALLSLAWALDRLELRLPALALSCSSCPASPLGPSGDGAELGAELGARGLAALVAACVWVGGLVTLAFLVWPVAPAVGGGVPRVLPARRRPRLGDGARGAYLALVRLPEASDLWETGYGRLLLVKLGVASFALAWGGIHHLFVRPRIVAGHDPRAPQPRRGDRPRRDRPARCRRVDECLAAAELHRAVGRSPEPVERGVTGHEHDATRPAAHAPYLAPRTDGGLHRRRGRHGHPHRQPRASLTRAHALGQRRARARARRRLARAAARHARAHVRLQAGGGPRRAANGVTLVVLAIWIFYEAIRRFDDLPTCSRPMFVGVVGIGVNVAGGAILFRARGESLNVEAAFRHVLADLLACSASSSRRSSSSRPGGSRPTRSRACSSACSCSRARGRSCATPRRSCSSRRQGTDTRAVGERLAGAPGVVEVHDLHIWTITSGFPALSAHVLVGRGEDCHGRRRELEALLATSSGSSTRRSR